MKIKKVVVGPLDTNCYILENDRECLIIDPGDEGSKIIQNIDLPVMGIIITHHHFDHIGALKDLEDYYKVNVYDFNNLKEGQNIISNFNFDVIYTPGHTADSISIFFKQDNILFSGDFIFKGSIGRTDLGGNNEDMKKSLEKSLNFNDDIKVYPGHFEDTIMRLEKENIRYFINII